MKTRHAALIRKGILAARDPELRQYVHLGSRLFREAAHQELKSIEWQAWLAAVEQEQAEHLRRFYA